VVVRVVNPGYGELGEIKTQERWRARCRDVGKVLIEVYIIISTPS